MGANISNAYISSTKVVVRRYTWFKVSLFNAYVSSTGSADSNALAKTYC